MTTQLTGIPYTPAAVQKVFDQIDVPVYFGRISAPELVQLLTQQPQA
ncbi:MAG: lipoate protein ligase C-terminal domain-containing protein [Levilactobacillus brevis]